ncbi:MAG TPA: YqcC family protein [Chromatiales bacterium]|nr:YqcC family protein [Chromatiales bacterium]
MNSTTEPYYRLMQALEDEMRRLDLWETSPPSAEVLESVVPFCYDTLEFTQWLQWVFVPKTRAIMDRGMPLPAKSEIAPLAEMSFAEMEEIDTDALLALISDFDRMINEG